jgi:hypothetical protein
MTDEELLRTMYDAFNARDIDAVLSAMTDDVDWPRAFKGGRIRGHDAVREYWTQQWAEIDPRVTPIGFERRAGEDGIRIAVEVEQVVHDRDGGLLGSGTVMHIYAMRDGLVSRMDVVEPA